MPWAKCRKSTERTVDFYLTECIEDVSEILWGSSVSASTVSNLMCSVK